MRGWFLGAMGAAMLFSGCKHSTSATYYGSPAEVYPRQAMKSENKQIPYSWCPTLVPGTQVEPQRLADGAALVFHTAGDVSAVRARVNEMAYLHDEIAGDAPRFTGYATWAYRNGKLSQPFPPSRVPSVGEGAMSRTAIWRAVVQSRAQFEDTDDGAKLVLTAKLPWDIPVIQRFADWRAQRMSSDQCAILGKPWPKASSPS